MMLEDNSPMPQPRTYHASCLVNQFMVVIGGEANNTDMSDFWALDMEKGRWYHLELSDKENFKAKRFLSATAISGNRLVTFGGCHSEYVHMNDVHIFDLSEFVASTDRK